MTVKELFKKMEMANEFAELVGGKKHYITLWDISVIGKVSTYKEYKKVIKDTYIECMVAPLSECKITKQSSYIGDFVYDYDVADVWGYRHKGTLHFEICVNRTF